MPLEVMNELGIKVTTAYGKCTSMDSREVPVVGCVKYLVVQLASYPGRNLKLDVVIVDCPAKWGMLLSRKWAASVGGSVKMDMSYATIPIEGNLVKLYGEKKMLYLIEDPSNASYEVLQADVDLNNFVSFVNFREYESVENKDPKYVVFSRNLVYDSALKNVKEFDLNTMEELQRKWMVYKLNREEKE
ncbi:hypothetical protein KI387_034960, partial [Taxus chinensis]